MPAVNLSEVKPHKEIPTRSLSAGELETEIREAMTDGMKEMEAGNYAAAASAFTTGWNAIGALRRRAANGSTEDDILESANLGSVFVVDGEPVFAKGGATNIYPVIQTFDKGEHRIALCNPKSIGIREARKRLTSAEEGGKEIEVVSDYNVTFARGVK